MPPCHPVNVLVMSPGGYNFLDYTKIGVPLVAILFAVVMIFLPLLWTLWRTCKQELLQKQKSSSKNFNRLKTDGDCL